tara:strand:- start:272 stop:487 length:216 start_codon:yes stop_codon:yes gene_type:complete
LTQDKNTDAIAILREIANRVERGEILVIRIAQEVGTDRTGQQKDGRVVFETVLREVPVRRLRGEPLILQWS